MDWSAIIEQMGGGFAAVVIAAQGFVIYKLFTSLLASWEKRLEREREHSSELVQTIDAVRSIDTEASR